MPTRLSSHSTHSSALFLYLLKLVVRLCRQFELIRAVVVKFDGTLSAKAASVHFEADGLGALRALDAEL